MTPGRIVALAGGVGAARFLEGLAQVVAPERLFVIGNTGDDAEIDGLHVSPDLDTVLYTLAGIAVLWKLLQRRFSQSTIFVAMVGLVFGTNLFSARGGQQIYFTPLSRSESFQELSERCRSRGHLALGLGRDGGVRLNIPDKEHVDAADQFGRAAKRGRRGAGTGADATACAHRTGGTDKD